MKKLGDVLAEIVGRGNLEKFKNEKNIFASWRKILDKSFEGCPEIAAAAAAHTNIASIKKGVLLVEADHTGWIQILRTADGAILDVLKKDFEKQQISKIEYHRRREEPRPC